MGCSSYGDDNHVVLMQDRIVAAHESGSCTIAWFSSRGAGYVTT